MLKASIYMQFSDIFKLIESDLDKVNQILLKALISDVPLATEIAHYLISKGGKRLRPILQILSAKACGYEGIHHIHLAAIVEFIHCATLLHDDVVDESLQRRSHPTANVVFGNSASVLVGDYLYSRAFQLMTETNNLKVMKVLADASNLIAEGEILQLTLCHNTEVTDLQYYEVIRAKTAKLFEAASQLGAVISGCPEDVEVKLAQFGLHLGLAFQLVDDTLDYDGDPSVIGKNLGDDLAQGKTTLPIIYAMSKVSEEQRLAIKEAIKRGSRDDLPMIKEAIIQTGAIAYTKEKALEEANLARDAISSLCESPYKQALMSLCDFSVERLC